MDKLEFLIPKAIATKKVSNIEIPLYGFVFQSEQEAWEMAIDDYNREKAENKSGATPDVKSTNRIAAAILAERVNPAWTADEVAARIPWNFAVNIYKIFLEESSYEAKKKEEAEAAIANTLEDSSPQTGEKSDTD